MAGGGPAAPSGGRRKSLDADINLVPFIDLLSMCICFLLMTAVWVEIGAVQVKQLVGSSGPADSRPSYEMDLKFINPQRFDVQLSFPGKKAETFKVADAGHDQRLSQLRDALQKFAIRQKINKDASFKAQMGQTISVARVTTVAGVSYGDLMAVMDTLRDLGIVNLGLVPVKE